MNRVSNMIASVEKAVKERLAAGLITAEKIESARVEMKLPMREYASFQQLKSLANTDGTLSLDEAMTVYHYLGSTPDTFDNQPFAVKHVLFKILGELAQKYHGAKSTV